MSSIQVIKISLGNQKVKTDLKKLLIAVTKTGVYSFFNKADSAAKESIDIANAFQLKDSPEDKAYQLILTAMVNAAHELIESSLYHLPRAYRKQEKLYDEDDYVEFLDGLTPVLEDSELTIDSAFFDRPCDNLLFAKFKEYFYEALLHFKIEKKDAEPISNRLPLAFTENLHTEWGKNHTQYKLIYNTLNTPFNKALQKQQEWKRYRLHLQRQIEDPVFDEPFGLERVYMPLRAYYEEKPPQEADKALRNPETKKIAVWLKDELDKWLYADTVQDSIRVISGGPGSGKSSFAKMWAADIAKKGDKKVLFIPLHRFRIDANVKDAVEAFVTMSSMPFTHHPMQEKGAELLIIFDGLDELVMQGKNAQQSAIEFIGELRTMCENHNNEKTKLKILIAGRPISVQNTDNKLRGRKDDQVLHLLPYFISEDDIRKYQNNEILKKDQRQSWWYKYNMLKEFDGEKMPTELQNEELDKITTEPLLNYLVALSYQLNPEKFGEEINLNQVYENLLKGVFDRDYEKEETQKGRPNKSVEDIDFDKFTQILEEIAICAWHGGDVRVTSIKKIEKHIQGRGLNRLLEEYKESAKGGVSRLLTAFYFRKYGEDEDKEATFEFTHKSFGEYLTARAIVQLADEIDAQIRMAESNKNTRRRQGWSYNKALVEWIKITGQTMISPDIFKFIGDEVKLKAKKVWEWQETFQNLINYMLEEGMPMPEKRLSHKEESNRARNAEESLLVIADACYQITRKNVNIDWKNHNINAVAWLARLRPNYLIYVPAITAYRCLNLSNETMEGTNFFKGNLEGVNLEGANLFYAILQGVNLKGANLMNANLNNSNLLAANLQGANLQKASLYEADLKYSDLRDTNLDYEQLKNAYSLKNCKGLDPEIEQKLRKNHPELFERE